MRRFCLLLAVFLLLGCEDKKPTQPVVVANAPAQEITGLKMEGVDKKGSNYTLFAKTAEADAKGAVAKLRDVSLEFEGNKGNLKASAPLCEIMAEEGFKLGGGVMVSWDGWTATLESATYAKEKGVITSDSPVELYKDSFRLNGEGLYVDVNEKIARVLNKVRAKGRGIPE